MASATPSAGHTEGAAAQVLPATPNAHPMSSKEPNPNTDYKMHFLKCKEKFDRVTSVGPVFTSLGPACWTFATFAHVYLSLGLRVVGH